ncbi:hypothetical protein BC828DRAFT_406411 [Blastocladiella britannica]|nr:hypothetical protein BC828DRAFT_406411 [Blastocladiella britannica]
MSTTTDSPAMTAMLAFLSIAPTPGGQFALLPDDIWKELQFFLPHAHCVARLRQTCRALNPFPMTAFIPEQLGWALANTQWDTVERLLPQYRPLADPSSNTQKERFRYGSGVAGPLSTPFNVAFSRAARSLDTRGLALLAQPLPSTHQSPVSAEEWHRASVAIWNRHAVDRVGFTAAVEIVITRATVVRMFAGQGGAGVARVPAWAWGALESALRSAQTPIPAEISRYADPVMGIIVQSLLDRADSLDDFLRSVEESGAFTAAPFLAPSQPLDSAPWRMLGALVQYLSSHNRAAVLQVYAAHGLLARSAAQGSATPAFPLLWRSFLAATTSDDNAAITRAVLLDDAPLLEMLEPHERAIIAAIQVTTPEALGAIWDAPVDVPGDNGGGTVPWNPEWAVYVSRLAPVPEVAEHARFRLLAALDPTGSEAMTASVRMVLVTACLLGDTALLLSDVNRFTRWVAGYATTANQFQLLVRNAVTSGSTLLLAALKSACPHRTWTDATRTDLRGVFLNVNDCLDDRAVSVTLAWFHVHWPEAVISASSIAGTLALIQARAPPTVLGAVIAAAPADDREYVDRVRAAIVTRRLHHVWNPAESALEVMSKRLGLASTY